MAKHPTSRRVHRETHDDDVFVATVAESTVWARENQRLLTIAGVVLVAAVLALLYYRNWHKNHVEQASFELNSVRSSVMQGNHQLAIRDLKQYLAKFGDTPAGDEARVLLAQVQMEENQGAAAVNTIKPLAGNPAKGEGATAGLLLGAAYESAKQLDKAEEAYANVGAKARFGFEKREALERAANVAVERGNNAKAAEYYQKAMETLPKDSPDRQIYTMRLAEVQAAAGR